METPESLIYDRVKSILKKNHPKKVVHSFYLNLSGNIVLIGAITRNYFQYLGLGFARINVIGHRLLGTDKSLPRTSRSCYTYIYGGLMLGPATGKVRSLLNLSSEIIAVS